MMTYAEKKARAREKAIDWQNSFIDHSYSWWELAEYQSKFERLGRRYGLLSEFKENGII